MKFASWRSALPLLAALLAVSGGLAAQQPGAFVDPALKHVIGLQARQAGAAAARFDVAGTGTPLATPGLVALERDARGRTLVGVLMAVSSRAAVEQLRARGVRVGTVVQAADGRILLTAHVPVELADSVTRMRGLLAAYASRSIKVENDSGMKAIHADQLRQRVGGVWTGQAGQGVIVGIYDTGLDFTHPDFLNPSGQTRVLGIWDQTATTGTPPGGGANFNYGNYCSTSQVQAAIGGTTTACPMHDVHGHGTHVTGTAAGNGGIAGTTSVNAFAGVAPAADLVIVKGGDGSFDETQVVEGVEWIDSVAARLHKPAAVNLSLGGQGGAHDGSSLMEQMLDALARPGFVVVVAAGNDGSNGNTSNPAAPFLLHAMSTVTAGQSAAVTFTVPTYTPNSGNCANGEEIDLWYAGADALDVTVVRPDGSLLTAATGQTLEADGTGGDIYIDNASAGADPNNGDRLAETILSDCGTSGSRPASGTWTLRVTGRSVASGLPFHVWLAGGNLGGTEASGATGFDNRYVVGAPGTARTVITVGAFTTKISWPTASGTGAFVYPPAVGDLAPFSSGGPTRDGRLKPEISAPGMGVMSSLSKDVPSGNINSATLAPDLKHLVMAGTSMATPHVTGSVALLLQGNPSFTSDQIRTVLTTTAGHDGFTSRTYGLGGVAQDWWGAGKLDVKAAVGTLNIDTRAVASVALNMHVDTIPLNATEKLTAVAYNALGSPLDSTVTWTSSNAAVATVDGTGLVHALALGNAWITAVVGTRRDSAAFVVTPPAQLALSSASASPATRTVSVQGARLPLLSVGLTVTGHESMRVTSLSFDLTGSDAGARALIFRDTDASGTIGANDRLLASLAAPLTAGQTLHVAIPIDSLTVAAGTTTKLILALQMSGAAPNAGAFTGALAPAATHTLGVRSAATDQLGTPGTTTASTPAVTSVLAANENFVLSENPVRSGHVVFNFSKPPTVAAVYSLTGRRIVDLLPRMENGGRVDWKLTNDEGAAVAPGIYLVVFTIDGQVVRRKLFIANSASAAGASQE